MKITLSLSPGVRFVCSISCSALLLAACAVTPTTQRSVEREEYIKGVPQPQRWAAFVKSADEGKVEQVSDEPEDTSITIHLLTYQFGPVDAATHRRGGSASEMFNGKFRAEAKTSYSRARKERTTDIESLLKKLPTDAQMTNEHHELIAKDKNHQNHRPRRTQCDSQGLAVLGRTPER
jgi:hypothetical protein